MTSINRKTGNILLCIAELIIGVLLLIEPEKFTSGIIVLLGIVMAMLGLTYVVSYFRQEAVYASQENELSKGILLVVVGAFCILKNQWFIATFPILTVLYGVVALVTGISKVQWAVDMLRLKQKYWYVAGISALATLIFAVVILLNPFKAMAGTWIFIGVSLIVEAVGDVLSMIFEKK